MERRFNLPFALTLLLPHGVIEIPMILLSSAVGLRLGRSLLDKIKGRGSLGAEVRRGLTLYVSVVLPLLLLAAVVEVYVTPIVVFSLFGEMVG